MHAFREATGVAAVIAAYSLLYTFVVDPAVGSLTGSEAAPMVDST